MKQNYIQHVNREYNNITFNKLEEKEDKIA